MDGMEGAEEGAEDGAEDGAEAQDAAGLDRSAGEVRWDLLVVASGWSGCELRCDRETGCAPRCDDAAGCEPR